MKRAVAICLILWPAGMATASDGPLLKQEARHAAMAWSAWSWSGVPHYPTRFRGCRLLGVRGATCRIREGGEKVVARPEPTSFALIEKHVGSVDPRLVPSVTVGNVIVPQTCRVRVRIGRVIHRGRELQVRRVVAHGKCAH